MKKQNDTIRLHNRFLINYKKNTAAIFFSFAFTFLLLSCFLILMHTNHNTANIEAKSEFTPSDCYIGDLTRQQVSQLKRDASIEQLAVVETGEDPIYERNHQSLYLNRCNLTYMTMKSKVLDGALPQKKGEVIAEKWALLNLGIEPEPGQEFIIRKPETGKAEKLKLTGILSDMFGNKKYGTIFLYTPMDPSSQEWENTTFTAYLQLKEGYSYEKKKKELTKTLQLKKGQIREDPAKENLNELYIADAKMIGILLFVCMIIFYGIYRIAFLSRIQQYGILRAVGMKKGQLQKMILLELYQIYWIGALTGLGMGALLARFILFVSGDMDKEIYFYNEKVQIEMIIPFKLLLICLIVTAALVGLTGCMIGRKAIRASIIETISGNRGDRGKPSPVLFFPLRDAGGKWSSLLRIACKYIVKDIKTSSFAVLTICICIVLFTGLFYRAEVLAVYRADTKEMNYMNGQYAMTMLNFETSDQGISRDSAGEIRKLNQVTQIKTASGMRVRVIDEDQMKRNESYYNDFNARMKKYHGYEMAGFDGKNQVYKSILYGYNEAALKALHPYVISGNYDPRHLQEDEIILSILRTDDTKENRNPGSYREGTPLMDYKSGDLIRIKYRADGKTAGMDYETFGDKDAGYIYKTYKIAAIVSFSYMRDSTLTVYPLMITSDRQIQRLTPKSAFQCMYVDGKSDLSVKQQLALEQKMIRICSRNTNVSTRSLISEIEQTDMFYHKQMVYVYGISLVVFVLAMIHLINNLRYRMQARTREISMLRAVGMSVKMTRWILFCENFILGMIAATTAFMLTHPVLRYLYDISDMKAFGHSFHYPLEAFLAISVCALIVCATLSLGILKEWKSKRILEGVEKIE